MSSFNTNKSTTITPALCLDRGGVPHIEADMANDILYNSLAIVQQNNTKGSSPSLSSSICFYYAQSYFDALSLVTPCKVSKRDALSEVGLRSYPESPSFAKKMKNNTGNNNDNSSNSSSISFKHILLPKSPLYPVAGGLPTVEAGPSQDLIQGRVLMTTALWKDVMTATKPDIFSPLCEIMAIQEVSQLPARKKQSLTMRNEKWMKETMTMMTSATEQQQQQQLLFPLGTHFVNDNKQSNKSGDSKNEDAAEQQQSSSSSATDSLGLNMSTGVGINETLYEQWCSLESAASSPSKTRLLALINIGSGETPEQRKQYLRDLNTALVSEEEKVKKSMTGGTLKPLQFIVGNVSDRSLVSEIEEVFFHQEGTTDTSCNSLVFDRNIICCSSLVPTSLAANGLALQPKKSNHSKNDGGDATESTNNNNNSTTTIRRDREDESTSEISDPRSNKIHQGDENAKKMLSTTSRFEVINLWDPTFKFSKLPLFCAQADSDKKILEKMNEDYYHNSSPGKKKQEFVCPCYACERHTAGYFHHLLDVHEMNAEILLTVHNYTQWFKYLMTAK